MAITIPNTFVAGTKIEASPMNANFAEVANAVDKRGDTVTGNIAANAGVKFDGVDLSTIPNSSGTFDPLFAQVVIGTADTNGIRLDLETGTLAVREGDDSAYAPLITGLLTTSGNHVPASNDGGSLGISGTAWADLFLASGAVANWNAGDITVTHASGKLTLAGSGAGTLEVKGAILPTVSNTPALGSASLMWADLFLGDGAVINFNNGDVTETHSTNTLTWAGASSGYVFNDGNVGIGVTPSYDLHVEKASAAAGSVITAIRNTTATGAARLYLGNDSSASAAYFQIFGSSHSLRASTMVIGGNANYPLAFDTNGTERMRITSGGNLAIGATAKLYLDGVAGTGDTYIFEYVANTIDTYAGGTHNFRVTASNASTYGDFLLSATKKLYLDGGGDTYLYESAANNVQLIVGGSGFLWASDVYRPQTDNQMGLGTATLRWTAVYAVNGTIQTSDRTLKRDISTDTLGLNFINRLRPVSFTMHDEADDTRRHGLIAQEVIEAAEGESLLGILTGEKDGEYGLNYAGFVPALIKAVQEQQAKIAALEARLN